MAAQTAGCHWPELLGACLAVLSAGCVLPGGLHAVGGQRVEGRLADTVGRGLAGQEIVLLQGHYLKADLATVKLLTESDTPGKRSLDRITLRTNPDGTFVHQFKGFTHCHPTWVIPPLLTLPSQITGETKHGSFFFMKTPGAAGRLYEIQVRKPTPRIRVLEARTGKPSEPSKSPDGETLAGFTTTMEVVYGPSHTQRVDKVMLDLTRKESAF